jgi:hypothetical protein
VEPYAAYARHSAPAPNSAHGHCADNRQFRRIKQHYSHANQLFSRAKCRRPPSRSALAAGSVFIGRKPRRPSTPPDPRAARTTPVWPPETTPWHRRTNTPAVHLPPVYPLYSPCIAHVSTWRAVDPGQGVSGQYNQPVSAKAETRHPKCSRMASAFGIRPSFGFRPSEFGFGRLAASGIVQMRLPGLAGYSIPGSAGHQPSFPSTKATKLQAGCEEPSGCHRRSRTIKEPAGFDVTTRTRNQLVTTTGASFP